MTHDPEENYEEIKRALCRIHSMEKELIELRLTLKNLTQDQEFVATGLGRLLWIIGGGATAAITTWFISRGLQ